jgi:hypothetical protein
MRAEPLPAWALAYSGVNQNLSAFSNLRFLLANVFSRSHATVAGSKKRTGFRGTMSGVLNLEVYWIASRPSLDVFVSLVTVLVAVGSAVKGAIPRRVESLRHVCGVRNASTRELSQFKTFSGKRTEKLSTHCITKGFWKHPIPPIDSGFRRYRRALA